MFLAGQGDCDCDGGGGDGDGGGGGGRFLTYRPLSNLPTPPASYKEPVSSADDEEEPWRVQFRGPAIHLVNLIPSTASLLPASPPLVQSILSRSTLPLETIALAVCILDSLDARFGRTWRLTCPLQPPPTTTPHIDAIRPELIILAALVLAAKFTVESHRQTRFYCKRWGAGLWSHAQLNATERCIVEALDYRIMPLWKEDCLADALVDMQLAAGVDRLREPSPPASVAW